MVRGPSSGSSEAPSLLLRAAPPWFSLMQFSVSCTPSNINKNSNRDPPSPYYQGTVCVAIPTVPTYVALDQLVVQVVFSVLLSRTNPPSGGTHGLVDTYDDSHCRSHCRSIEGVNVLITHALYITPSRSPAGSLSDRLPIV
jgi:hypothetical protein